MITPVLADTMFKDRATQFRDRLGWDVAMDAQGYERDEYDAQDPLYVIWECPDGHHGGSMRFLPTTGQTMVNHHFSDLIQGDAIKSPFIWECTRFCLAPRVQSRVAAALMLGGGEVMRGFGVTPMRRRFRRPHGPDLPPHRCVARRLGQQRHRARQNQRWSVELRPDRPCAGFGARGFVLGAL